MGKTTQKKYWEKITIDIIKKNFLLCPLTTNNAFHCDWLTLKSSMITFLLNNVQFTSQRTWNSLSKIGFTTAVFRIQVFYEIEIETSNVTGQMMAIGNVNLMVLPVCVYHRTKTDSFVMALQENVSFLTSFSS